MKRVTFNALVDLGSLIAFVPTLYTGLVLYLFLPSGGGRGNSWSTWMGITRHDWIVWHDIASFTFAALVIVHLLLHWKFYKNINRAISPPEKETGGPDR